MPGVAWHCIPQTWLVEHVAVHGAVMGHALVWQQCEAVPAPPNVQMSTQLPLVVLHVWLAPQDTPVQTDTHEPLEGSHLRPLPHVTPVQLATHEPLGLEHF